MINSIDPDQMPHSVASDLGLHCLLRPVHLNILSKYGNNGTLNTHSPGAKEASSTDIISSFLPDSHKSLFLIKRKSVLRLNLAGTGSVICWNRIGRSKVTGCPGLHTTGKVYG